MNTMLKLTTLGILLACAGTAAAANAAPTTSIAYLQGPIRINPQPLPPRPSAADREAKSLAAPILVAPNADPWFCLSTCRA